MDEDEEGEEDEEEKAKIENNRFQTNIVNENQNDFAPMKNPETQNNGILLLIIFIFNLLKKILFLLTKLLTK